MTIYGDIMKTDDKPNNWVNNVVWGTAYTGAFVASVLGGRALAKEYVNERTPARQEYQMPAEEMPDYDGLMDEMPIDDFPEPHIMPIPNAPVPEEAGPKMVKKQYPYTSENDVIFKTAERIGVPVEYLFAIRRAENGGEDLEFGIIPNKRYNNDDDIAGKKYEDLFEDPTFLKQASWAAHTIQNRMSEWNNMSKKQRAVYVDFVDYLGDKYCPVGAKNDPNGLNANWEPNMREFVKEYSKEEILEELRKNR